MSNAQNLETKRETLENIPVELVKEPRIPIDAFVQEADDLHYSANKDKDKLTAAGLDWELVTDLPVRTGALREAQSQWLWESEEKEEGQRLWNEQSPEGFELRDDLLHIMRFAFRKNSELLKRVSQIAEGDSNADMVQDLNDCAVVGKENPALIEAVGETMGQFDRAAELSNTLGEVLAMANGDRHADKHNKLLRDRAYTHLKEAVDEIRTTGKFVFWKDDKNRRRYESKYLRKY